jgi:hypothetical protein
MWFSLFETVRVPVFPGSGRPQTTPVERLGSDP